jgi:tryptophan synthase alpha subunit
MEHESEVEEISLCAKKVNSQVIKVKVSHTVLIIIAVGVYPVTGFLVGNHFSSKRR